MGAYVRYLLAAFLFVILLASKTSAATCTNGSLATYVGLGSAGCTIGSNTLSNFTIEPGSNGATAISPGLINIMPLGGSADPGITIMVEKSAAGNIFEAIFNYTISGNGYKSETYTLAGSSETGGGGVTGVQNNCAGGVFSSGGVSGCSGVSGSLLTLDGIQNQDSGSFDTPFFLSVTDDFTIDGTGGTAAAGTLTDRFSAVAVPEPASIVFSTLAFVLASGLLFLRGRKSITAK